MENYLFGRSRICLVDWHIIIFFFQQYGLPEATSPTFVTESGSKVICPTR